MADKRPLSWLRLPESMMIENLDSPENIQTIRQIIQRKRFLRSTYISFYREMLHRVKTAPNTGEVVELGSGASFLKSYAPYIVTSDVLAYRDVDRIFSALDMPFANFSISAFLMIDVLHHLKDSRQFFQEVLRCLQVQGKVVMIEPANTVWSRLIYTHFHHEPFEVTGDWGFESGGPLTGANMAIPWIIFGRDLQVFTKEFPTLKVVSVRVHTPLRYLLSGGLSFKQLLPNWTYPLIRLVEQSLSPLNPFIGMFMTIELEKVA